MTPNILSLPDYRDTVIVVGTSYRKPLNILKAHLASLAHQELPPRVRLEFVGVPDFAADQADAQTELFRFINERKGTLIQGISATQSDFSDAAHLDAHQWSASSMARVGENKNLLLRFALAKKADYVFLCDADLILDRTTIASLLSCDKSIATATYWTRWSRATVENNKVWASPQVWLRHPYHLDGRGLEEAEFRQKLLSRNLVRVWGFGACTLIGRKVLEAGVDFSYLSDVPTTGLMGGEDRHFCIKCERMHIDAYADNWPDVFHIYHAADDVPRIPAMTERLSVTHPERASIGDLVSIRLRPLEPLPVAPGRFQQTQPQLVRGRLGALELMPELEEVIYSLTRGEKQVVRVHFPIHHEMGFLRGRTRLIEVTLLDVKPYALPPVVEDDLYVGPHSGAWTQQLALTPAQHESAAEVASG